MQVSLRVACVSPPGAAILPVWPGDTNGRDKRSRREGGRALGSCDFGEQ